MPTIRQLPASLVNKIAAGEVIERPASVVKELMENSIDAGASSIELAIEGGGTDLIRISDNGCGIEPDQMGLAISSHATSKLETADDLFNVRTLGFRGEALASIAEISHLTIRTRTKSNDAGSELFVQGGEAAPVQPVGCPVGTTIEVRHLFFNTPVRRKFMRTPQTEAGHITEAFTRIALAYPQVQMKLTSGSKVVHDLDATDSWKERIRAFFGDEIADSLISVESEQQDAKLSGYVADPSVSRSNNRMQYLFLNGRHIRDRALQHALSESYRGLLMVGRFPVCFLRLQIPPELVDVNVHPTKMEVRFQEGGKLYSQLLQTLRHRFLTSDLTARAKHSPGPLPKGLQPGGSSTAIEDLPPPDRSDARWDTHAERMSQIPARSAGSGQGLNRNTLNLQSGPAEFRPFPNIGQRTQGPVLNRQMPAGAEPWSASGNESNAPIDSLGHDGTTLDATQASEADAILRKDPAQGSTGDEDLTLHSATSAQHSHLGYQVHNRYLITQDENGMVVGDQHALHERILYEQLRQKTGARNLESQRLLVPEPIDLTPAEAAAAIEHREVLMKIGIEIESFGGDTILLTSYPAMLANLRPAEVLRQAIEPLMAGGKEPSARDMLDELLNMIACKAAVKAGDRLSPEEIASLLEQRHQFQDTHHCPHGRPTALFFSREQLDRMFKRT